MKEFKTEAITENLHSVLEFIDGQLELIGCPMKPQMQIDISVEEIFVNIARYLCPERSNAFVVAMLWYAMLTGSDIRFEAPVSKQLYDGLTGTLIPALAKGSFRAIRLEGEVTSERVETQGGVVSGLSCGADSFYTLHCYGGEDAPVGKKLPHLSYYMADYLFPFVKPPYDVDVLIDEQEKLYNEHVLEYAGMIAEHHKLPFLVVRTNLDRDYYRGGLIFTGMYRF